MSQDLAAATKRVRFGSGGFQVEGQLCMPPNSAEVAVLFNRGGAIDFPAAQTFEEWQKNLASNSYASLFFDPPGTGWSSGKLSENTMDRRLEWSVSALDYLLDKTGAAVALVVGSSMGADQAVRLVKVRPQVVKAVVLSSPGMYGKDVLHKHFGPELQAALRQPQSWADSPTIEIMRSTTVPFLVFYTEHEDIVPQQIRHLYANTPINVDFRILKNVGHKYLSPMGQAEAVARQKVYNATLELLKSLD